ncbi:MAG TPA: TIGR02677 family protein [Nevskiaceae bacterium]
MHNGALPDRQLTAALFRHVSADRGEAYRAVLDAFAAAKRRFRLHLRADEVRAEAAWPGGRKPEPEEVARLLEQLVEWGNLRAQADTARVTTVEDFYRARFLYQLSREGEAVETGLAAYAAALERRATLQTVALEDIQTQLAALARLAREDPLDDARVHQVLRELVHVYEGLAGNAEDFMAGLARTVELQSADATTVMAYKDKLIEYLQRFIGDLVAASAHIAQSLLALEPVDRLLEAAASRESRDVAPGDADAAADASTSILAAWRDRWLGLRGWFLASEAGPSQAQLLRAQARSAIPRVLAAIARVNERRTGRSDRGADYRVLAHWFAAADPADCHRLWRAAFGLAPARHLALTVATDVAAMTPWAKAPAIPIEPTLRERGRLPSVGGPPRLTDRSAQKRWLADQLADERAETAAARERLISGDITRLSQLGRLDRHTFRLFLNLLGEVLADMRDPAASVERRTRDGSLVITFTRIPDAPIVVVETEDGAFAGADHWVHIRSADANDVEKGISAAAGAPSAVDPEPPKTVRPSRFRGGGSDPRRY